MNQPWSHSKSGYAHRLHNDARSSARWSIGASCVCAILSNQACSGPDPRWDATQSGVAIVTNDERASAPTQFSLSHSPVLAVGGPGRSPDDGLAPDNGALSASMLSSGGLVVAEETRLVVFDVTGNRRAIIGRSGSGPGEFRFIHAMCRTRGDTIVVEDFNNAKLVVIDARAGTIVSTFPNADGHLLGRSCFGDGTFLVQDEEFDRETRARTLRYLRMRLDGTVIDTFFSVHRTREQIRQAGLPHLAVSGSRWFYADPYFSEIRSFDVAGNLTRIIRSDEDLLQVSRRDALAAQGMEAARGSQTQPAYETEMVRKPFYGDVMADPDGMLWVNDLLEPGDVHDVWTAFDPSGKMLGRLLVPVPPLGEAFNLIDFTSGGVLMRRYDENGDTWVEHYRLENSTRP